MSANDLGQYDPMIRPAPGEEGAFHCALCGNCFLRIGWAPEDDHAITVRLYCPNCGNWFDWLMQLGVPGKLRN